MTSPVFTIVALASAVLSSASTPSLRWFDQVEGDMLFADIAPGKEKNIWDIARSFTIDGDKPHLVKTGKKIFDFSENEVTVTPRSGHYTNTRTFKSSEEGSKQSSLDFGLSGGYGGFTAAINASTKKMHKSDKEFVRIDHDIETYVKSVQMDAIFPYKFLLPDVKELLLTGSPEEIYNNIGPFYATQFVLGTTYELRVVGETSSEQESSEFEMEIKAGYKKLVSFSAGGGKGSHSKKLCTSYSTSYSTSGGNSVIWNSLHADGDYMMDKWEASITDENLSPLKHKLKYIWTLLDHDDMDRDKAKKVKAWILDKWRKDSDRIKGEENALVRATSNKQLRPGDIIIKQPSGNYGGYKKRFVKKNACEFVNEGGGTRIGYWGLDQLRCSDFSLCLKWGDDSYVGRLHLPKGIKATTYSDWELTKKGPTYGDNDTDEDEYDFWNNNPYRGWEKDRVKGFKFELTQGYTCGEKKCISASS